MLITSPTTFETPAVSFPVLVETMRSEDLFALGDGLAEVDLLVIPLTGVGFDAVELIERLGTTVFMGRIRVVSDRLPDRNLVLGELRDVAEPLGLTVELRDRH